MLATKQESLRRTISRTRLDPSFSHVVHYSNRLRQERYVLAYEKDIELPSEDILKRLERLIVDAQRFLEKGLTRFDIQIPKDYFCYRISSSYGLLEPTIASLNHLLDDIDYMTKEGRSYDQIIGIMSGELLHEECHEPPELPDHTLRKCFPTRLVPNLQGGEKIPQIYNLGEITPITAQHIYYAALDIDPDWRAYTAHAAWRGVAALQGSNDCDAHTLATTLARIITCKVISDYTNTDADEEMVSYFLSNFLDAAGFLRRADDLTRYQLMTDAIHHSADKEMIAELERHLASLSIPLEFQTR